MAQDKLQIDSGSNVMPGSAASKLHLVRAFNRTKSLFEKNEFAQAKSREDFIAKLDQAVSDNSSKPIRLDI